MAIRSHGSRGSVAWTSIGGKRNSALERTQRRFAETTMLDPRLPPEMLDYVIDHLHDTRDALRNCCLVSKSWIPRTRKHLFADIKFPTVESLQSWKETFPDPSTSPARYANTLAIDYPQVVTAVDEASGWIRAFSRVEHLEVGTRIVYLNFYQSAAPLVTFHGFSPFIKSLRVVVPHLSPSRISNLIISFPLLEDLAVIIYREALVDNGDDSGEDGMSTATQPSSPPIFTGSLELHLEGGMEPFARRLLFRQGGIHFRELTLTWVHDEDLSTTTTLVEECSHTLELLNITCNRFGTLIQFLRPHPLFTPFPRRVEVNFD
jgi:hypothetical protein